MTLSKQEKMSEAGGAKLASTLIHIMMSLICILKFRVEKKMREKKMIGDEVYTKGV